MHHLKVGSLPKDKKRPALQQQQKQEEKKKKGKETNIESTPLIKLDGRTETQKVSTYLPSFLLSSWLG